jgi:hypothetical protein
VGVGKSFSDKKATSGHSNSSFSKRGFKARTCSFKAPFAKADYVNWFLETLINKNSILKSADQIDKVKTIALAPFIS